ncbi:MAG TPA: lipase maturation factor family protein [Steroidobacteraceae bacterium]|jgi:predicted DCC family thiol-disulfide oxidoreductase YuxK|nr:lipase maturation factor family protein [Steroidobacteraceae bacterium]
MGTLSRPLLIYDGDCGFCGYWARYWQKLTGERMAYRTYQEVAAQYPEIPLRDFQRAVQYIAPDGRRASAAEASFLTLSHARGKGIWLALYHKLPGFAAMSERAYAFIAAHRAAFFGISRLLWGKDYQPPRHELVAFLFLRLFGLIYLSAFISFAVQAQGLIGSHGILPLAELVDAASSRAGPERFLLMPMVFWWNASDLAIRAVCWAGAGLSLLLVLNLLPRVSLLLLHALYLSLLYGGQTFMTYQWDVFLLETGFAALLMSFATTPGIWLLRWLLFRFMLMSGVVKLLSGDANWWNLSALSYHFLTQPLPTPLAWYVAQLPPAALRFATGGTFVVELIVPFFFFFPRRLRFLAAFGTLLLQSCILLTGNYNWFNLQTMLLCLVLFDDAALQAVLPRRLSEALGLRVSSAAPRPLVRRTVAAAALLVVFCSLVQMDIRFGGSPPAALLAVDRFVEPLRITSAYGLFSVMTTQRDEIIIEGSYDGLDWREYEFRYKPGDQARRPRWNIPHQPRLDWQMWFAALDDPRRLWWFERFLQKLLENEPTVTSLLATNPFANRPPVYVRAEFYDYRYADSAARERGMWWERRSLGLYFPVVRLKGK